MSGGACKVYRSFLQAQAPVRGYWGSGGESSFPGASLSINGGGSLMDSDSRSDSIDMMITMLARETGRVFEVGERRKICSCLLSCEQV